MNEPPLDGERLQQFRELRGMSKTELARLADCDRKTIESIENNEWEDVGIKLSKRIVKALDISLAALTDIGRDDFDHVDYSDGKKLEEYLNEMRDGQLCRVCTRGIDSYLVPDVFVEWSERSRLKNIDWPEEELEPRIKSWLAYVGTQRSVREHSDFQHEIIAPEGFFGDAFTVEPEWLDVVKKLFTAWENQTAVGLVPAGAWRDLNQFVKNTVGFRTWDKICIVDDTLAMIRPTRELFLFTRKPERIERLHAILDMALSFVPYGLPSQGELSYSESHAYTAGTLEKIAQRSTAATRTSNKKGPAA